MRGKGAFGAAIAGVFVISFFGCVGDEPGITPAGGEGDGTDAGGGTSGDDSGLSPDAAPPAHCPLGCLPPAPPGWTGPSATYDGVPNAKPTECPTPYTQPEISAHQGAAAEPATCSCGDFVVKDAKCAAGVELWQSSGCNSGQPVLDGTANAPGPCHSVSNGAYGYIRVTTPTLTRGSCTYPSPQKTAPEPTFDKAQVACGLPQVAACDGRADCVATPVPAAPFTRLCIHKDGDAPCPSADYANRIVAYKQVDDTRDCSPCEGTPAGGACGSRWGISANDGQCAAGIPPTTNAVDACVSNPGIGARVNVGALLPTGITCTTTGGAPTGAVTATEPVTFCCNR